MKWKEVLRLFSRTEQQNEFNNFRLDDIIEAGAAHCTLLAGHGFVQQNGITLRDNQIPAAIRRKILKEADNCGGLLKTMRYNLRCSIVIAF